NLHIPAMANVGGVLQEDSADRLACPGLRLCCPKSSMRLSNSSIAPGTRLSVRRQGPFAAAGSSRCWESQPRHQENGWWQADFLCCIHAPHQESPLPAAESSPENRRSKAPWLPPCQSAL